MSCRGDPGQLAPQTLLQPFSQSSERPEGGQTPLTLLETRHKRTHGTAQFSPDPGARESTNKWTVSAPCPPLDGKSVVSQKKKKRSRMKPSPPHPTPLKKWVLFYQCVHLFFCVYIHAHVCADEHGGGTHACV